MTPWRKAGGIINFISRLFAVIMMIGEMTPGWSAEETPVTTDTSAMPLKNCTIKDVNLAGGEILGLNIQDDLVLLLRSRALEIVDFSKPARPVLLSRMNMPGRTTSMAVNGHAVYVGVRQNGVHMIDFENPRTPRERGFISTETLKIHLGVAGPYLSVWAHYKGDGVVQYLRVDKNPWQPEEAWVEDYRHTDRYAVIGTTALEIHSYFDSKESLLSVKAPDDADRRTALRFPYDPESGAGKLLVDGKQGAVLANGRLYLLDLRNPLKPTVTGEVPLPQVGDTENVSAAEFSEQLLMLEGNMPTPIDISDPRHPRVINWKCPRSFSQAWLIGNVMLVRNRGNSNPPGVQNERYWLTAFDFSNPAAPEERAIPIAEAHQPTQVIIRGKMVYAMTPNEGLKIIDCSNPKAIRVRGTLEGVTSSMCEISGSKIFVVGYEGVRAIDLTDPDHPASLGFYRVAAQDATHVALGRTPQGKTIAWVANGGGRLEALDMEQPPGEVLQGWINLQGEPWDLKISGQRAYVGAGDKIFIVDIHQPEAPALARTLTIQGAVDKMALTGNLLLAATYEDGMAIVDIKNPAAPRQVGTYLPQKGYKGIAGIAARGDLVFLACSALEVVSVADPAHPRRVGMLAEKNTADAQYDVRGVVLHGQTAFTPQLVDLANPAAPRWVESFKLGRDVEGTCLASAGRFVYFLDERDWSGGRDYTLSVCDATNPLQPVKLDDYTSLINTWGLAADEAGNIFIADGIGGLVQLRLVEDAGGRKP